MRDLTFSRFRHCRDQRAKPITQSWDAWCEHWSKFEFRGLPGIETDAAKMDKMKDGWCVVLGAIDEDMGHKAANVKAVHALSLDLEKLNEEQMREVFAAIEPYEYFVWTTYKHRAPAIKGEDRLRVVLPLGEPITDVANFKRYWRAMNRLIGGRNDAATCDPCRLNYEPATYKAGVDNAASWRHAGRWLSVAELPAVSVDTSLSESDKTKSVEVLVDLSDASRTAAVDQVRHWLRYKLKSPEPDTGIKVLKGESFASTGGRHQAMVAITWALARDFPKLDVAAISEVFGSSLATMREEAEDAPTIGAFLEAYVSAIPKVAEARAEGERERKKEVTGTEPYGEDDLKRIAAVHGWQPEELKNRWILMRDNMRWFLDCDGHYRGPYKGDEAEGAMWHLLGRAPVRLIEATNKGFRNRTVLEVFRESGTTVYSTKASLVAQATTLDVKDLCIIEAVCPLRNLEPAFDPELDKYFRLLSPTPALYEKLIDWLSVFTDLSKLLCGLYYQGEPGTGKNMLMAGLAACWNPTATPTDLQDIFGNNNDSLIKCPLAVADEDMPKPVNRTSPTTILRTMISTTSRPLRRKYRDVGDIQGAVRVILAANNDSLLDTKEVATSKDLKAIAQRFLYFPVSLKTVEFLNETPKSVKEEWINNGIAKHVAWLRANHTIKEPGKRFWVEGDVVSMHRLLMTGSRWNSLVCEWLVRYLISPGKVDTQAANVHIIRGGGRLFVNVQVIIDKWATYLQIKSDPETAKIGAAVRALSKTAKSFKKRVGNGERHRFYEIDIEHLIAWSEHNGVGDRDAITKSISLPMTVEGIPMEEDTSDSNFALTAEG